ncbi:MAG: 16S rRNA (guanine(966)-N(2))-methyltransferase RsmD [Calditrichaceae bacterium]|nr:16S rRNA (guanine(966)-N(2))-methyltransferase RsmD [Calditrichaceae bacterium]MBN2710429.1 16S rRNA (guanine(966)-N(2))-methyltransferase RsmD [Calditrichaceae bacterium]RQV93633.1 MAG: 16S rRNA (guanine(966)-N(2))-methyltransferase RsmD [Calditrichota bacterium]
MRIISGQYKGRRLISSEDFSIRPTTDRVKEYIFNILQDFPLQKNVADIFAGSGNLGLEALSRGAKNVVFVEKSVQSIKILQKNIENLKLNSKQFRIENNDAIRFAQTNTENFDLFLLDPPFNYPELQKLINGISGSFYFKNENLLVLEHEITNLIEMENQYYTVIKQKKFGRSLISFLIKKVSDAS